jgi:hypothetical protein
MVTDTQSLALNGMTFSLGSTVGSDVGLMLAEFVRDAAGWDHDDSCACAVSYSEQCPCHPQEERGRLANAESKTSAPSLH